MDVRKLFLCCLFKAETRNRLSNLFMSVLQNTLSCSRIANPTSKYQNMFLQQNKTPSCDFFRTCLHANFKQLCKLCCLGYPTCIHISTSVMNLAFLVSDYMTVCGFYGNREAIQRISSWMSPISGDPVTAPQPVGSQCSQILNKCSWTIFRVRIVPSVIAALVGFNYGLYSVFKHLDSFFHTVYYS